MSTEQIANRQLFYILFMMRTTIVISLLPVVTSADALQDAWASGVVSFFGAAVVVIAIGKLAILFPNMTIVEYSQAVLGVWLGRLVSFVALAAFLFVAATDTRIYAEVLITGFLTETPITFIASSMIIVAAIAAHSGIETVGRCADLFFPVFLAMVLAVLILPMSQIEMLGRSLEPALARGWGPVIRGAVTPTAIILQFLVLSIAVPSVNEPRKTLKTALWALAASSLVLIASAIITLGILGPDRAARSVFPLFSMVRSIQISEFLERVEVLAILSWGFGMFIGLSMSLFCGARGMAQLLGLSTYRPLVGPMAIIWMTLSVHAYEDVFQLRQFFTPAIIGPFVLVILLFTVGVVWSGYAIHWLLRRRWWWNG